MEEKKKSITQEEQIFFLFFLFLCELFCGQDYNHFFLSSFFRSRFWSLFWNLENEKTKKKKETQYLRQLAINSAKELEKISLPVVVDVQEE